MARLTNIKVKEKESLFSSRRVFYFIFSIFILAVIGRFIAIKNMDNSDDATYLYQFDGDVYADLRIENNRTVLKKGERVELSDIDIPPYSFIKFNLNGYRAIYQFIPDRKSHSISLFTKPAWYEIIGGNVKNVNGETIIRLKENDEPSLLIRNVNLKKSIYRAKEIEVIALKEGFYYQTFNKKVPIPCYQDTLKRLRRANVWRSVKGIKIDKSGFITDGKEIIKISLGYKHQSVQISKNPKKYNLIRATTIDVAVVDLDTPSSTLKLVDIDSRLYKYLLPYEYTRLAHLLIKYQVADAKRSIEQFTRKNSPLRKELLDKIEDYKNFKNSKSYKEYLKRKSKLTINDRFKLQKELISYIIDGDYYRAKKLIELGADVNYRGIDKNTLLDIVLNHQYLYVNIPKEMKFKDNRLLVVGNSPMFKANLYFKKSHFSTQVPILDKPFIPKKDYLRADELNEFVEVTHLNGLYINDKNAKVYYSKKANSFIQQATVDYRKSPPLFLYNPEIEGKFVAPIEDIKGRFYYRIKSKYKRIKIAFNGKIRLLNGKIVSKSYNQVIPFYSIYTIPIYQGGTTIEVIPSNRPLPCGAIFTSTKKIDSLKYSYNKRDYRDFEIIYRGDKYLYRIKDKVTKPFRDYKIFIKANGNFNVKYLFDSKIYRVSKKPIELPYSPSLACLIRKKESKYISLYEKDNLIRLIPKEYKDNAMRPKEKKKRLLTKEGDLNLSVPLSKELIPIYGDGIRFGLTSKGYKIDELSIDSNFSKEIAGIFLKTIKSLESPIERRKREKAKTILEGATVVLASQGKKLEVVGMFSYPYPKDLDIKKPNRYKKELFRYILQDKYGNKNSPIKNRVFDMRIHPGSTFKMVMAIAGYKSGIIPILDKKYRWSIEGREDIAGSPFRNGTYVNIHLKNFSFKDGRTEKTVGATFKNSFKFSYNVYFGYLSLLMNHKLDRGFKKVLYPIYGTKRDRIDNFPLIGITEDLGFNSNIFLSKNRKIYALASSFPEVFVFAKEIADVGIGQFDVMATPMQMAIVANTIRTGNIEYPTIVKDEPSTIMHKNYISPIIQQNIKEAMYKVINDADGTAKCAFYPKKYANLCYGYNRKFAKINVDDFSFEDVKVYGKTGTAEKGKGKLYDGWFVAFAQSEKYGDIVVATVVRNSGTGGTYSATITKKIIEAWYSRYKK